MPFVKKISIEAGTIGIWKLSETVDDLFQLFRFSPTEKQEFNNIKSIRRKTEYLSVRLLLEIMIPQKQCIVYRESGKPELAGNKENISISHSSELIVIFLSVKAIGIDVENTQRNIEKVTDRFLHKDELAQIQLQSQQQNLKILYWSAKEAIFKCTEKQNILFKEDIAIQPFILKDEGKFDAELFNSIKYELGYFFYENNVIVYCVE